MTFGDKLENGAVVIEARETLDGNTSAVRVVLAHWYGAQPWVTWSVDREGYAYHGHYFPALGQAIADLDVRCPR